MLSHWILILLLALSTYISRILGIEIMGGREISPAMRLYFNYVPVGVISALVVKQILVPENGHLSVSLPVLTACIIAAIVVKKTKMFLPSLVIGGIIGLLVRNLLS